mmetsp:Transcript_18032/g.51718  ORF Transcript_18032/g.51718 Transcript_18032/m.51718 type:complete len:202 (+) Transcript_18032:74-679(+)
MSRSWSCTSLRCSVISASQRSKAFSMLAPSRSTRCSTRSSTAQYARSGSLGCRSRYPGYTTGTPSARGLGSPARALAMGEPPFIAAAALLLSTESPRVDPRLSGGTLPADRPEPPSRCARGVEPAYRVAPPAADHCSAPASAPSSSRMVAGRPPPSKALKPTRLRSRADSGACLAKAALPDSSRPLPWRSPNAKCTRRWSA